MIREEEPPKPQHPTHEAKRGTLNTSRSNERPPLVTCSVIYAATLDWIVMMAIDKDRNRRYGTANELALDLGRSPRARAGRGRVRQPPATDCESCCGGIGGRVVCSHPRLRDRRSRRKRIGHLCGTSEAARGGRSEGVGKRQQTALRNARALGTCQCFDGPAAGEIPCCPSCWLGRAGRIELRPDIVQRPEGGHLRLAGEEDHART